jgi:hypothetical protein
MLSAPEFSDVFPCRSDLRFSRIYQDYDFLGVTFCILFICLLFNNAVNILDYTASNGRMIVKNDLERTRKSLGLI